VELTDAVALVGGFPALAGATLDLQPKEIVGVRGPNGAGKSTLLRLCAGLVALRRGEGNVLGCDLATRHGRRAVRRSIGLLGHETALYDDLSVVDNITFWSCAHRAEPGDVHAAMEHMGLSGRLANVSVSGLSAGQRRRTAIAILLARRPRLWLLDEPHAALDSAGRDLLDQLIRDAASAGATVLVATHDRGRIDEVLTRTVSVDGGVITEASSG
jgi:heme ABC exporter ATP-binding subunit CcmA